MRLSTGTAAEHVAPRSPAVSRLCYTSAIEAMTMELQYADIPFKLEART